MTATQPAAGRDLRDVLLVEDEPPMRRLLTIELGHLGYNVVEAASVAQAGIELDRRHFDVVITDLALAAGSSGLDVLDKVQETQPGVPVIILSGRGTIADAVKAIRGGAYEWVTKPVESAHLAIVLDKAIDFGRQKQELELVRRDQARLVGSGMVGEGPAMTVLKRLIAQVAATDTTVLVHGESGTGKELVARALHANSPRRDRPFVAVDCGALEANLLASEMFGHVKGAFTGADSTRQGLFQAAHRGTLFLDEIGNLPLDLQARLLRVLQERRVRPVGGNTERELDVRVVAATNRDLARSVADGTFRQDLYYRLAVVTMRVPPVRERREDIPALVQYFARVTAARMGRSELSIRAGVLETMQQYDWPGNVRELANVVERAVIMTTDSVITEIDLPEVIASRPEQLEPLDEAVRRAEREAIRRALEKTASKAEAARSLGISRRALYDKMAKLAIGNP